MKLIRRILGFLGFGYCVLCGEKMKIDGLKGYDNDEMFICPKCKLTE